MLKLWSEDLAQSVEMLPSCQDTRGWVPSIACMVHAYGSTALRK